MRASAALLGVCRQQNLWVALLALYLGMPAARADRKAVVHPEASVHANADDYSRLIGTYHKRTTITVSDRPQGGWYRVIFPKPVKGFTQGWIRQDGIEGFLGANPKPVEEKEHKQTRHKPEPARKHSSRQSRLGLVMDFFSVNPAKLQDTVGEKKEAFFTTGYSLEYDTKFSESFVGFGRATYYSFTRKSSVQTGAEYSAKGYIVMVGGDLLFVHGGPFELGLGAGIGLALNEAGNTAGNAAGVLIQQSTSGIGVPTFMIRLAGDWEFGESGFGMKFEAGYRVLSLSKVPVLAINGTESTTADFALSGVFAGVGLELFF